MNVDAGKRLCHPEVINAIEDLGLKNILLLLSDFIDAFEDSTLSIIEKCIKVRIHTVNNFFTSKHFELLRFKQNRYLYGLQCKDISLAHSYKKNVLLS